MMLIDKLELCGLLVNYWCFNSFLDSHADGTHSPQRIHWGKKWCNAAFLQICSDEETLLYILDAPRVSKLSKFKCFDSTIPLMDNKNKNNKLYYYYKGEYVPELSIVETSHLIYWGAKSLQLISFTNISWGEKFCYTRVLYISILPVPLFFDLPLRSDYILSFRLSAFNNDQAGI